MKLELLGWKSSGIAGIDMDVDLTKKNKPSRISMIWLDSGGGKTTTHHLIKTCLSGDLNYIQKNLKDKYARKKDDPYYKDIGKFELYTLFDNAKYTFKLTLNFKENTIDIETEGGTKGHSNDYRPPSSAIPYLRKKFVDLFILDGELTSNMVNEDSDAAETTLETIYQLDNFSEIHENLERYFEKFKKDAAFSVSDQGKITQITNKISLLKERGNNIQDEIKTNSGKIIECEKTIKDLKNEEKNIKKSDESIRNKLSRAEGEAKDLENEIKANAQDILNLLKGPFHLSKNIANEYVTFKNNLEKMKIPEHSTKEFFRDLLTQPKCICDEPMTEERKKIILKNSENFIGTELTTFLNAMKSDVSQKVEDPKSELSEKLTTLETEIDKNLHNLLIKNREIENFRVQGKNIEGRSLQDIQDEKDKVTEEKIRLEAFIKQTQEIDSDVNENTNPKNINSLPAIKKLINDYREKLGVSQKLRQLDLKIEKIQSLLNRCKIDSKNALKEELVSKMNTRLSEIVTDDIIKVSGINKSILHNGASTGQSLALIYVFLSSAFELAGEANQFPLCVDSPAAPIGPQYRKIVAKMIAQLSNQYICLLQGGERYAWCKTLYDNSKDSITVITLFKKSPYYQKYFDNPHPDQRNLENSGMVHGYEFLRDFDSEDDEDEDIKKHIEEESN